MNIVILSRNPELYSTEKLREAAERRSHHVRVVDVLRCFMNIASRKPTIRYGGEELTQVDAVIPRIGASNTFYGTAVVRQFETMGVYCANGSEAISRSRDKLRCLQILARDGIDMPVSGIADSTKDIDGLIASVGGAPLVVKLVEGTQGSGVILAETRKAAEAVIEAFRELDANILVQEFIAEAAGTDLRCIVVGDEVVASMVRVSTNDDFRSNLHRGGIARKADISSEERELALAAARSLGLQIAGVDILRSNRGPLVMEINSSPGLEGIEMSTGIDVSEQIIAYVEQQATLKSRSSATTPLD